MSIRRRTTVYDLASLRLHPDGSRVQNVDSKQKLRRKKNTVRDARGNWIATDAGGLGTVKLQKQKGIDKAAALDSEEERRSDRMEKDGNDAESSGRVAEGRKDDSGEDLKDPRAKKRRKFQHDLQYLDAPVPHTTFMSNNLPSQDVDEAASRTKGALPLPSSDLLKCIHHFASEFFTGKGQLFNAREEARREKKLRKFKKLSREAAKVGRRGSGIRDEHRSSEEDVTEEDDDQSHTEEDDGAAMEEIGLKKNNQERKGLSMRRCMYKAFDGSALMAIGMLLQEQVVSSMCADRPEGWERDMDAHGKGVKVHRDHECTRPGEARVHRRKGKTEPDTKLDVCCGEIGVGRPKTPTGSDLEHEERIVEDSDETSLNSVAKDEYQ